MHRNAWAYVPSTIIIISIYSQPLDEFEDWFIEECDEIDKDIQLHPRKCRTIN